MEESVRRQTLLPGNNETENASSRTYERAVGGNSLGAVVNSCPGGLSIPRIIFPSSDFVFWGRTRNQLAQLVFFEHTIKNSLQPISTAIAHQKGFLTRTVADVVPSGLLERIAGVIAKFDPNETLTASEKTVDNFFIFVAAWFASLAGQSNLIKGLLVANDHSPRYVAAKVAANLHGIPTIYLQHAPVTKFFPSLEGFDCAVLLDAKSQETYEEIGPMARSTFIAPRPNCLGELEPETKRDSGVVAGIFLTRNDLLNFGRIVEFVRGLLVNETIQEVRIFPHPGVFSPNRLGKMAGLVSADRSNIDVAVVGNSGIVNELLASRSHVYYVPELDWVRPHYHPVTESSRVHRVDIERADAYKFESWHKLEPVAEDRDGTGEFLKYLASLVGRRT